MRKWPVLLCLLLPCLVACKAETGPGGGPDGARTEELADLASADLAAPGGDLLGISATEACREWAGAVCDKLMTCRPVSFYPVYADLPTCMERLQESCRGRLRLDGSRQTPATRATCALDIRAQDCGDYFSNRRPLSCSTPAGTLPDGAACGDSDQCQSGRCDAVGAGCGKCAALTPAGSACTTSDGCQRGLVCSLTPPTCRPSVGMGAACGGGTVCDAGLYCESRNSTCVVYPRQTNYCFPPTIPCDLARDGTCDTTRGCIYPSWSAAGGPCGVNNMGRRFNCIGNATCPVGGGLKTCTSSPFIPDGAACATAHCLSPAVCEAGTCKIFDPATCK